MSPIKLQILNVPQSGTTLLTGMIVPIRRWPSLSRTDPMPFRRPVGTPIVGNKLGIPNHINFEPPLLTRVFGRYGYNAFRSHSIHSLNDSLQGESLKLSIIVRDPAVTFASIVRREELSFDAAGRRWKRGTEIAYTLEQEGGSAHITRPLRTVRHRARSRRGNLVQLLADRLRPAHARRLAEPPYTNWGGTQHPTGQSANSSSHRFAR
jgi:hypothetical protein